MQRVATNTLALIGAQAGVRLASLLVVLLMGRLLGPDGLGLYAMATAVAALAVVAADAGVDTVTIRAMAAGQAAAPYLGALLPLRLALLGLAALLAAGGALLLGYPPLALGLTLAFTMASALEILAGSLRAALRAAETMVSEAVLIVAGQALRASLMGGALLVGLALPGAAGGALLAALGSALLAGVVVMRRHGRFHPRLDWALWRAMAVQTAPVTAWLLLTQVGARSDAIIIGQWWPAAEAGRFHAANGVLGGLSLLVSMALAALYPALVRARAAGDKRRVIGLATPVLGGGLAVAITVAMLAPLVVEPLLTALLTTTFIGAGPPLLVLRWVLPAYVLSGVAGVVLRSSGDDRPLALVALLGAAVSLALNLALIPTMGAMGAAVRTLTAEIAMAALALVLLRPSGLPLAWPVLGGGVTGGVAGGAGVLVATLMAGPWWLTAGLASIIAASLLGLAAGGAWALTHRARFATEPRP